jgi:hypothetical protein
LKDITRSARVTGRVRDDEECYGSETYAAEAGRRRIVKVQMACGETASERKTREAETGVFDDGLSPHITRRIVTVRVVQIRMQNHYSLEVCLEPISTRYVAVKSVTDG